MKKHLFSATIALLLSIGFAQPIMAQKGEYRQSQSRMIEPQQEVFVRPLVVDLNVITDSRQKASWNFPEADITKMTVLDMSNLKANALYLTAQKFDADVIVAASFDIHSVKKGLEITVIGFPAKYTNWKVASKEEDYKWIKEIYGTQNRYNPINMTKALEENAAKNSDTQK